MARTIRTIEIVSEAIVLAGDISVGAANSSAHRFRGAGKPQFPNPSPRGRGRLLSHNGEVVAVDDLFVGAMTEDLGDAVRFEPLDPRHVG